MRQEISLIGATGSIGVQTLQVARLLGLRVKAMASRKNIDALEQQVLEFSPEVICVFEEKAARELKRRRPSWSIVSGMEGLCEVAVAAEMTIIGMQGSLAILPVMEAIKAGRRVGLANKEVLVAAGQSIMELAKKTGVEIIPIDSEHSAIFQCLQGESLGEVSRLILTASGGPFLHATEEELHCVTVEAALKHPTWKMGGKITIDSSTMMNKGFEVIEARWLFDMPVEKIDVVIHPQSLVHSMVEFVDGAIKAQVGVPGMEVAIQYAITYPNRLKRPDAPFDFGRHGTWEFFAPDRNRFRCLELAYEALRVGGSLPCVLNAGNEVLVDRFCRGEVSWLGIAQKLETLMGQHKVVDTRDVNALLEVDRETRLQAELI